MIKTLLVAGGVLAGSTLSYADDVALKTSREKIVPQSAQTVNVKPAADLPQKTGFFQSLADHGVFINADYLGEFASNFHGGQRKHKSAYSDQETLGALFDFEKMVGWDEGFLDVQFTNRNGHSLAMRAVNNDISFQQIYGGGQTYQLTSLILQQGFSDNLFNISFGRMNAKNGYYTSSVYCKFQNNFLCGNPGTLTKNTNPSYWPVADWGAQLSVNMRDDLRLRTGVYRSEGDDYVQRVQDHHGFYWSFSNKNNNGWWVPVELKYHTEKADYPMMFAVGGAYQSGSYSTSSGQTRHRRGILWAQAEGMVWKPDPASKRGLYLFSAFDLPTQNYGASQLLGGFSYTAPFKSREDDAVNFVANWLHWRKADRNALLKRNPDQFLFELNYSAQVLEWLNVTPNLQYMVHPNGRGGYLPAPSKNKIPNTWMIGLQVSADVDKLLGLPTKKLPD